MPWTRHILDDLGYDGLAVCGQGAQVYHAGEHKLLTSLTLDRQLMRPRAGQDRGGGRPGVPGGLSRDGLDGEVLVGPGYRVQEGPLPYVFVEDSAEMWTAPLNKVYLQHPELDDDALATAARAAVGSLVDVVMAGPGVVEILPLGLSKATGLSLAARLGVKAADTIAFGDMPNDIPMFGWAHHGVAMANAHDDLKAVAHEITASNEDDGIAVVLEELLRSAPAQPAR